MVVSWQVTFIPVNDVVDRDLIVCCDKEWGEEGCRPFVGDCYMFAPAASLLCCSRDAKKITAVTSSDPGRYYYRVEIWNPHGKLVKTCERVDILTPCTYVAGEQPPPSPPPPPPVDTSAYLLLMFAIVAVALVLIVVKK